MRTRSGWAVLAIAGPTAEFLVRYSGPSRMCDGEATMGAKVMLATHCTEAVLMNEEKEADAMLEDLRWSAEDAGASVLHVKVHMTIMIEDDDVDSVINGLEV